MSESLSPRKLLLSLTVALLAVFPSSSSPAEAAMLGGAPRLSRSYRTPVKRFPSSSLAKKRSGQKRASVSNRRSGKSTRLAKRSHGRGAKTRGKVKVVHHAPKAIPPQLYLEKLNQLTVRPGVVHKFCKGGLNVNVVEVDMKRSDIKVRPYLASETFDRLKNVEQHAKESGALVAVNANYFKKDGTPLGTIKVDGEWVSGSLFNRVAMGISDNGDTQFARVNLHGILETSNPSVPRLWVNNMNQPRRHGVRLVLYTRRWGNNVNLAYDGTLVAVSNRGEVVDTSHRIMTIPYGGYVLTDKKDSELAHLKRGDFVDLEWQTDPKAWNQVHHAISGGPTLIKNGQLFVGLKAERFRPNWTSSRITRRTACGVTADRRLILATVEGPHNMWDLAKFMQQMGCVEAMNLDGGGSTTMVVNGNTVTGNDTKEQRKVAATITVMETAVAARHRRNPDAYYQPTTNLRDFTLGTDMLSQLPMMTGVVQAHMQQNQLSQMTFAESPPGIFLGAEQYLAPPNSINAKGLVMQEPESTDKVIDIDNDLVGSNTKIQPKSAPLQHEEAVLPVKTPVAIPQVITEAQPANKKVVQQPPAERHPQAGWTKLFAKPFKFGKNRS